MRLLMRGARHLGNDLDTSAEDTKTSGKKR
jgi:hypothetical protein